MTNLSLRRDLLFFCFYFTYILCIFCSGLDSAVVINDCSQGIDRSATLLLSGVFLDIPKSRCSGQNRAIYNREGG